MEAQVDKDLLFQLKNSSVFSVRRPTLATAVLFFARAHYFLMVYWVEATPSVDAVLIIDGTTGDETQLSVSDLFHEENIKCTKQGVVCYVVYDWKESDVPEILTRVDTRVDLIADGTPQQKTVPIRFFNFSEDSSKALPATEHAGNGIEEDAADYSK